MKAIRLLDLVTEVENRPLTSSELWALTSPKRAFDYAFKNGPWPAGEPVIARDPVYSYYYANDVLHGRFLAGEQMIRKDGRYWDEYQELLMDL